MDRHGKVQALRRALGHELITKGDELVFLCPRCHHHKPKLSVNVVLDKFNCWICHFRDKSSLAPLLLRDDRERYSPPVDVPVVKKTYDVPRLPAEFRSLAVDWHSPIQTRALRFLSERGLDRTDVIRLKLGYCETGYYANRVVFPSFDAFGELSFVVGRLFYDVGRFRSQPKYLHGNYDKDIIFNEYLIDWSSPVVLVEGPFDAAIAQNAIALQGCWMDKSSRVFSRLIVEECEVVIALDRDTRTNRRGANWRVADTLMSYGIRCSVLPLGEFPDVGAMSKTEFSNALVHRRPLNDGLSIVREVLAC